MNIDDLPVLGKTLTKIVKWITSQIVSRKIRVKMKRRGTDKERMNLP